MPNPNLHRGSQFKRHGGVALDSDYLTYEGAMSTPPSATWQTAVNQMILDIKTALSITSLSDAFDAMWFLAAETEQASRLNMVKRAHDCTATAAPTFVASRGITSNGSTQFLHTNFVPSTQGVRHTLDSASIGVYSRTDNQSESDIGAHLAATYITHIRTRTGVNNTEVAINSTAANNATSTNPSQGLFVANRSASNAVQVYKNGASVGTNARASATLPAIAIYLCCRNNNGVAAGFSTRQLSLAFIGGSMNATQQANFYTAVQTCMTTIGANV